MPSLLQSLSSFFSPTSAREHYHIRRDQAMSSIDDAFAVPPDAEYAAPASPYTYPPPAHAVAYDAVPAFHDPSPSSARPRPAPLLPLHHAPLSPLPHYPPLPHTWARLRAWLDGQYPELGDTLNWGLPPPELAALELELGLALPPAVRDSYLLVDGQEAESAAACPEGLFFGLTLLPFEDVVAEWRFWREVDHDPTTGANAALRDAMRSIPPGWIRREYSQRGWLPLVADKAGNYLGVDMNPDDRGAAGQVIVFGRDFDTKVVMWRGDGEGGWARWLASFADELESGEGFELGGAGDGSEGSEDDLGYESYFFDGTGKGEGGGDGAVGGLRLTGEYRGWPVLEAFADRSMKRWIGAGVMAQPTPTHIPSPNAIELGLESPTSPPPDAVLLKSDGVSTPTQTNGDASVLYAASPPSISITKVPAPLPVQLPTERDLLPSPTFSSPIDPEPTYELEHDEDAGDLPMREVTARTPVQANFTVQEATLVPLPSDTPPPAAAAAPSPQPLVRQATDPLANEAQALLADTTTPEPSPPPLVDTAAAARASSVALLAPSPVESLDPLVPAEDEEGVPHPTVRLVGGGRAPSLVDDGPDLDKKLTSDVGAAGASARRKTEAA